MLAISEDARKNRVHHNTRLEFFWFTGLKKRKTAALAKK